MIYLIVGKPRSGKSQFAVKKIFDIVERNEKLQKKLDAGEQLDESKNEIIREVYADIEGLNIPTVKLAPKDWREVPRGGVIFYDEVHFRSEYEDLNGKPSQNPMIKDLTTHGHKDVDIYLITQTASRLERSIRGLIDCLYYVKRPQNKPPFCMIYEFDSFYNEPKYAAAKGIEHDKYMFNFKDKYQNAYKSASSHTTMQFKIQKKFIYAILAIILLISCSVWLFFKGGGDKLVTGKPQETKTEKATGETFDLNECRKAENLEKKECKQFFDDASKNGNSIPDQSTQVAYDPNRPYDVDVKNLKYDVVNKPKFSGCVKFNGKYQAYSEQGTVLKGVSQEDCKRLLEEGDRPYDYFSERNKPVVSPVANESIASAVKTEEFSVPNKEREFSNYHNAVRDYQDSK